MHLSLGTALDECLEAALIVGVAAAVLRASGRAEPLRRVRGAALAGAVVALCAAIGLRAASVSPTEHQQAVIDTVLALVAVGAGTCLVAWMRQPTGDTAAAGRRSAWLPAVVTFVAVARAGLAGAVFVVASFVDDDDGAAALAGAVVGVVVAATIGWAIARHVPRLGATHFARVAGVVLVLVAAGQVVAAVHQANAAGWLTVGQGRVHGLPWLVEPGSVREAVFTGLLGIEHAPVAAEVICWVAFLAPGLTLALWPATRRFPRETVAVTAAAASIAAVISLVTLVVTEPPPAIGEYSAELRTGEGVLNVRPVGVPGETLELRVYGAALDYRYLSVTAEASGQAYRGGRWATVYRAEPVESQQRFGRFIGLDEIAAQNGGRLPAGVSVATDPDPIAVAESHRDTVTVWADSETGLILDAAVVSVTSRAAELSSGTLELGDDVNSVRATFASASGRARRAGEIAGRNDSIAQFEERQWIAGGVAVVAAVSGLVLRLGPGRRRSPESPAHGSTRAHWAA